MKKIFDVLKPRKDTQDESKTYWDPIGVLFVDGEKKTLKLHMFDGIFIVREHVKKEFAKKTEAKKPPEDDVQF